MKKHATWLSMVGALLLVTAACGDDSGSNGTGATGGSNSGDGCADLCSSPCVGDIGGAPEGEVQDCIDACSESSLYEGCESELGGLVRCLEGVDCDSNAAASACRNQTLDFAQCFSGVSF